MARPKEVYRIVHAGNPPWARTDPPTWWVEYTGQDGLKYGKSIKAKDEMEAYAKVMGIRK